MKEYKFKAICSGDYEVFCFAVSKEDYKKIKGKEPHKLDKDIFNRNKYKIYPNDLFGEPYDDIDEYIKSKDKEYEIEIKIKEV